MQQKREDILSLLQLLLTVEVSQEYSKFIIITT